MLDLYTREELQVKNEEPSQLPNANSMMQIENEGRDGLKTHLSNLETFLRNDQQRGQQGLNHSFFPASHVRPLFAKAPSSSEFLPSFHGFPAQNPDPQSTDLSSNAYFSQKVSFNQPHLTKASSVTSLNSISTRNLIVTPLPIFQPGPLWLSTNTSTQSRSEMKANQYQTQFIGHSANSLFQDLQKPVNLASRPFSQNFSMSLNEFASGIDIGATESQFTPNFIKQNGSEIKKFSLQTAIGSTNSLDEELHDSINTKHSLRTFTDPYPQSINSRLDLSQDDIFGIRNGFQNIQSSPDLTVSGLHLKGLSNGCGLVERVSLRSVQETDIDEVSGKYNVKSAALIAQMKETRAEKVKRYRNKRLKWKDLHSVNRNFSGRSMVATSKPRIKGRFVKQEEYEKYLANLQSKELSSPSNMNDCESQNTVQSKIEEEV